MSSLKEIKQDTLRIIGELSKVMAASNKSEAASIINSCSTNLLLLEFRIENSLMKKIDFNLN